MVAEAASMSLNVALAFASRGYAVLPVGPDKRPWIKHGVHAAATDPRTILRWSWTGAACAVATGESMEVLDVDVRRNAMPLAPAQPLGAQGKPSLHGEGDEVDGFSTLKALGLDWQRIEALALCARTPSGGVTSLH
jgi:Bifunctional DNA primase/polymerase, N-terminal